MKRDELIGSEMRTQRLIKRLTLDMVAERLNCSKNTVSYMELGKKRITIDGLIDYCNIVGCNWLDIIKKVEELEEK